MPFDTIIVETLLPNWPVLDGATRAEAARKTVLYVSGAIALAPFHIRFGVALVSVALGLSLGLLNVGAGTPMVRAQRAAHLYDLLQKLPGPVASVVRLYRSMTLLAYYEQPAVAALLHGEFGC